MNWPPDHGAPEQLTIGRNLPEKILSLVWGLIQDAPEASAGILLTHPLLNGYEPRIIFRAFAR
jgi:hypothetical protein